MNLLTVQLSSLNTLKQHYVPVANRAPKVMHYDLARKVGGGILRRMADAVEAGSYPPEIKPREQKVLKIKLYGASVTDLLFQRLALNPAGAVALINSPEVRNYLALRLPEIVSLFASTEFWNLPENKKITRVIDSMGTSFVKLAQIAASSPDEDTRNWLISIKNLILQMGIPLPIQVDGFLDQMIFDGISSTKSHLAETLNHNFPGMTDGEARDILKNRFPQWRGNDIEFLAAGSVGSFYRITYREQTVVAKIRKPDLTLQNIETEEQLYYALARVVSTDEEEYEFFRRIIYHFFSSLKEEIDFKKEANNSTELREQGKRFRVPEVYAQGRDSKTGDVDVILFEELPENSHLLSDVIAGLQIGAPDEHQQPKEYDFFQELINMFMGEKTSINQTYQESERVEFNRADYVKVPRVLLRGYMEQLVSAGILHADPHGGNCAVELPENLEVDDFVLWFFDTGSVVKVTKEAVSDLAWNVALPLIVGDADALARGLMNQAVFFKGCYEYDKQIQALEQELESFGPTITSPQKTASTCLKYDIEELQDKRTKSMERVTADISLEIKQKIFDGNLNLNNPHSIMEEIEGILLKYMVLTNRDKYAMFKSMKEVFDLYACLCEVLEIPPDLFNIIAQDIFKAGFDSVVSQPRKSWTSIREIYRYAQQNPLQLLHSLDSMFHTNHFSKTYKDRQSLNLFTIVSDIVNKSLPFPSAFHS